MLTRSSGLVLALLVALVWAPGAQAAKAPTSIVLSKRSVAENLPAGTTVATLKAKPTRGKKYTFKLVKGAGSTNNASFKVSGTKLKTRARFDFERRAKYAIRLRATDRKTRKSRTQRFTIAVTDVKEPTTGPIATPTPTPTATATASPGPSPTATPDPTPTGIVLSSASVPENQLPGAIVGALTTAGEDGQSGLSYALVSGDGDADNAAFIVDQTFIKTAQQFNYEQRANYSIRVRVTDAQGRSLEQALAITVSDVNEAPTSAGVLPASVREHQPAGQAVGTLFGSDPDVTGSPLTFALVDGAGATDNASFAVDGMVLRTAAVLQRSAGTTRSIRLRATDAGGLSFDQVVTITVDLDDNAPTDIALSTSSVNENAAVNTVVGNLIGQDPDPGDPLTFAFATGAGAADNASFNLSGTSLRTSATFDFETKSSYTIRLRATDAAGLSFEKALTVTVLDVPEPPTNIGLAPASVAENTPVNTVGGTFSATDPDAGDPRTFALVAGAGATDNGSFNISGANLRTNAVFDFETKSSYAIRVRVTDSANQTFEKSFTITISNVDDAPTSLGLSASSVAENAAVNTTVGTLSRTDPDAGDTATYTLVTGPGDTDNASFNVAGTALRTSAVFDYETKTSYAIRLRITDAGGLSFEQPFTITVTNVNEPPSALSLSNASVAENQAANSVVGTLSSVDPDGGDTAVYTLVSGTGSTDNASFSLSGATLRTSAAFDFETKPSYSIRVRATDEGGLSLDKVLTISVTNVNEAPTNVGLAPASVAENAAINTTVGTLSSTDPDAGGTFTYTLVAGTGSTDNASFNVSGTSLRTSAVFDFETKSSYSIRVRSTDGGGLFTEKQLTITVTNVNEAPTALNLSNATLVEGQPVNTVVGTLSATDPDAGDTQTFALVAGTGSTDNASFNIAGTSLRTSAVFNAATKSSYAIRVRVTDAGGLAFDRQLTITVTPLDSPPTAIALSKSTVAENQAVNTVVGALSATDPDAGDTFTYTLVAGTGSTDNASFNISGANLRTSASFNFEVKSSYAIRIRVTDAAGQSFEQPFTITVTNVNEAPTAGDESFSGAKRAVGNTALVVNDPTDGAPDPAGPQKTVSGDLLADATDPDAGTTLAVTAGTITTNDGGSVTMQSDGDFTFFPKAQTSCSDHSDFFDYTVTDGALTDTGRVTIAIQDCVWYIDSTATTGTGTSSDPFFSTSQVNLNNASDPDSPGDTLFIAPGTYPNGLDLEASEQVYSKRSGLTMPDGAGGTATLEAATPAAAAATLGGVGILLATDNTLQGVDAASVSGTNVGTVVMGTVTPGAINSATTGDAVQIQNGTLNMAFTSVSSHGGTYGIRLDGTTGTFSAPAGAIDGTPVDTAVTITGGAVDFTYGGSIASGPRPAVNITFESGGTKDFNGPISSSDNNAGDAISVTVNSDTTTTRFDGGLTLTPTGSAGGLTAHSGGTVAVTDPAGAASNTISTATGPALVVADTVIAAGGLTFEKLSSNGATEALDIERTGNLGGLVVTGAGTADSGGVIQASPARAVVLQSVGGGVSLSRMRITGSKAAAITGNAVNGFTLDHSTVTNNGDAQTNANGVVLSDPTGAVAITNSTLTGNYQSNVALNAASGTVDLTVTGNTIAQSHDDAVIVGASGSADIDALFSANSIQSYGNNGLLLDQTGGALDATVRANTISAPAATASSGLRVQAGSTDPGTVCADLGSTVAAQKNAVTGSGANGQSDIAVDQSGKATVKLPGYGGAANNNAAVVTYLQGRNNPSTTPTASASNTVASGGGGFVTAASCTLP